VWCPAYGNESVTPREGTPKNKGVRHPLWERPMKITVETVVEAKLNKVWDT
jgi:hypothetical protein